MTHLFDQPMLSLSAQSIDQIHNVDADDLKIMWAVFTKCKAHLENGRRLENMSWRLWYHEKQHHATDSQTTTPSAYFSYASSSSSSASAVVPASPAAASTTSTASGTTIKRFISALTPEHDILLSHPPPPQQEAGEAPTNGNAANGTASAASATEVITKQTPTNSESHDRQTRQDNTTQQHAAALHKRRVSILHIGDEDEDDHSPAQSDDGFVFTKSKPGRTSSAPQPSLLTAMLHHNDSRHHATTAQTGSASNKTARGHHFLYTELSESLRRNVLWEHIQQRALYPHHQLHRNHPGARPIRQDSSSHRPPRQTEWLESFHGW